MFCRNKNKMLPFQKSSPHSSISTLFSRIASLVFLFPSLSQFEVLYTLFVCWFIVSIYKTMRALPYLLCWLIYKQFPRPMPATQEKFDSTRYPSLSEFLCSNYSLIWLAKMFTPDLLSESKTRYCISASKHQKSPFKVWVQVRGCILRCSPISAASCCVLSTFRRSAFLIIKWKYLLGKWRKGKRRIHVLKLQKKL